MITNTDISIEIYDRIVAMVRPNETKEYIRDGRWKPVKEFICKTWQAHIDVTTKRGRKVFAEYDWLEDLHSRISYADYKHFFDVYEIVCLRYAQQR